jgi:hypothetical protein
MPGLPRPMLPGRWTSGAVTLALALALSAAPAAAAGSAGASFAQGDPVTVDAMKVGPFNNPRCVCICKCA